MKMKLAIIPRKMSNTGSIHDLASQHYDREIFIPDGGYAVVLASYYGGRGHTAHATEEATIREDRRQSEFSRQIIGADGWYYDVVPGNWGDELKRCPDQREPFEVLDLVRTSEVQRRFGVNRQRVAAIAKDRGWRPYRDGRGSLWLASDVEAEAERRRGSGQIRVPLTELVSENSEYLFFSGGRVPKHAAEMGADNDQGAFIVFDREDWQSTGGNRATGA